MKHLISLLMLLGITAAAMAQNTESYAVDQQIQTVTEQLGNEEFPDYDPTIAEEYSILEVPTFMGSAIYNRDGVLNLLARFLFNLLIGWILIHFCYYRKSRNKAWYLTFILFSSSMFMLIFLMESVKLEVGFIFGLFAIFGMIRYRTEAVPVREMTYLFIIIAMSVMNGLAMTASIAELAIGNVLILVLCFIMEALMGRHLITAKLILYDKIDMVKPEKREELLADLKERTGIQDIEDVEIGHIDYLRDVAFLKVYYPLKPGEKATINDQVKPKG